MFVYCGCLARMVSAENARYKGSISAEFTEELIESLFDPMDTRIVELGHLKLHGMKTLIVICP